MSNKKNGNGILYFANGDKRVGVWKDDKLHGQATYYYSGGRIGDDNDDYNDNDNDYDNDNDRRGGVGGGQQAVGEAEKVRQLTEAVTAVIQAEEIVQPLCNIARSLIFCI